MHELLAVVIVSVLSFPYLFGRCANAQLKNSTAVISHTHKYTPPNHIYICYMERSVLVRLIMLPAWMKRTATAHRKRFFTCSHMWTCYFQIHLFVRSQQQKHSASPTLTPDRTSSASNWSQVGIWSWSANTAYNASAHKYLTMVFFFCWIYFIFHSLVDFRIPSGGGGG